MCKYLLLLCIAFILFIAPKSARCQNDQLVNSGQNTTAITFPAGCKFNWTNDNPSIGLAASGTGDISSFKAINNTGSQIKATIIATPITSQSLAYISDNKGALSVIDLETYAVKANIQIGITPIGTATDPFNNRVYIANQSSNTISVINTLTNTVAATINSPQNSEPSGVALSPDGTKFYVTEYNNGDLAIYNTSDNKRTATIHISSFIWGLAVSPDGTLVYIAGGGGIVSIVNTVTKQVTGTIQAGVAINDVCISPDGNYLYVTDFGQGGISVIDTRTRSITGTVKTGEAPTDLTISPDGKKVYVTNITEKTVTIINASNNSVIKTVNVGDHPEGICVSADGSKVYVVNSVGSNISIINTSDYSVSTMPGIYLYGANTIGKFIFTSNCQSATTKYTITVHSQPPPTITTAGSLPPLTTVYGTPSTSGSFTISGTDLVSGILVTPPPGFELSTDGINFSNNITVGSTGTLTNAKVFVRLAKITNVGDYTGNVILKAGNTTVNVIMPTSTVTPAPVVITANNKSKPFGANNPPLTVIYSGFVNNDQASGLTNQPLVTTTALASSPIGTYPIIASGASSPNYTFTYISGELTITPADIIIPNIFTPNSDGANDTWAIKYIEYYPNCKVDVFNRLGTRIFSSIGYSVPWNGRLKDHNLPSGVYYYTIDIKNNAPVKSGWVTIIR